MEIEPYERARFLVTAHGERFLVDVLCHRGNGCCSCATFLARIKPRIDEDKSLKRFKPGDGYRCPHIKAARGYLLDRFVEELRKQFPDDEPI